MKRVSCNLSSYCVRAEQEGLAEFKNINVEDYMVVDPVKAFKLPAREAANCSRRQNSHALRHFRAFKPIAEQEFMQPFE
jgi:hypothetical protein